MDNIPTTLPKGEATTGKLPFDLRIQQTARDMAEFNGFSQGYCYSFESPKVFDNAAAAGGRSSQTGHCHRKSSGRGLQHYAYPFLNGMLTSLGTNYKRRNKNVRLYELGNIYIPKALPLTELPDERMIFTLGMYGEGDFYTIKGVVEEFLDKIGMRSKEDYDPNSGKTYLHPGRQANIGLRRNCDRLSGRGASYSSCFLWNRRPGVCGCSGYAFYHEICYLRQKIRRNRKIPG